MNPRLPPLPVEPLLRELELRSMTPAELMAAAGETPNGELYARLRAPLRWYIADRYAVALDLHPVNIWGDAWLDLERASEEHRRAKNARRTITQRAARERRRLEAAA